MEGRPFFSIIIPVYNVEDYLAVCLKSIIDQTMKNIEIICVNDGSTDSSLEILEQFAKTDKRIQIIDKENGGLSSARNAGIRVAEGEYLLFVDSDDMLRKDACERLFMASLDKSPDIIIFGTEIIPHVDYWFIPEFKKSLEVEKKQYENKGTLVPFEVQAAVPYVWNKCWKKGFLDRIGLEFREDVRFGEDTPFLFSAYPKAYRIHTIPDKLYRYRVIREGSLMDVAGKDKSIKALAHLQLATMVIEEWDREGYLKEASNPLAYWFTVLVLDVLEAGDMDKDVRKEVYYKYKALLQKYNMRLPALNSKYIAVKRRVRRMEKRIKSGK